MSHDLQPYPQTKYLVGWFFGIMYGIISHIIPVIPCFFWKYWEILGLCIGIIWDYWDYMGWFFGIMYRIINIWLVVDQPTPLKNRISSVGIRFFHSQLFLESLIKFHSCSSHHQAVIVWLTYLNFATWLATYLFDAFLQPQKSPSYPQGGAP